jgi:putative redox protein
MSAVQLHQRQRYTTRMTVRGHEVVFDEPLPDGGDDLGPTPVEGLLGALGACMAITVSMYARRKGWPLSGITVDVEMTKYRKADYPAYTGEGDFVNEFRVALDLQGELTDEQRARMLEIAGKCPVHRILTQPNIFVDTLVERHPAQPPDN